MKLLEVFNRKDRKWIAQIQAKDGEFPVQAVDDIIKSELNDFIKKTVSKSLRHIGAIENNGAIAEIVTEGNIEANEKNLLLLEMYLSKEFLSYRFVFSGDEDVIRQKETAKKLVENAKYLDSLERGDILKRLNDADLKETILIISDMQALDMFFRSQSFIF